MDYLRNPQELIRINIEFINTCGFPAETVNNIFSESFVSKLLYICCRNTNMARNVEFDEDDAIQKAMEVFWEKGYNGTSLRDLTDAMKINSSSLYNTIGDKNELYVRCIKRYTDLKKEDFKRRLSSKKPAFKILTDFVNDAVNVIAGDEQGCMAIKAAFEVGNNDKRVKKILKEDSEFTYQFLALLIRKAMDEGDIAKDEDPELIADFLNSTWTGWYESYILHKDPVKIKKMGQYFIRQLAK
ncbi:MAG: TetR/AcrR family transcriptional regulator [Citrobacter freundii]|nr:MAG: TetR/AcrR family transcriptional regulator [Citrobacter freundii]